MHMWLSQVRLLSDRVETSAREVERELDSITNRLSTLLATLQEFPVIRYRGQAGWGRPQQSRD
jgi:hypothetical protein